MSAQKQGQTAKAWVDQEFAAVRLGDVRLDRRLLQSALCILQRPDATNPQRMDWNELRCLYRLLHSPRAQPHLLQESHRLNTHQRMLGCCCRVLIVHDTTEIDFTTHLCAYADLGPIGTGAGVGLLQHNSLAFNPASSNILGLIHQVVTCREPAPVYETRTQCNCRAEKQSRLWLDGFRGVGRAPEGHLWIDICDRAGDFFQAMQLSRELNHHFLIRVVQDRCVKVCKSDPQSQEETQTIEHVHEVIRQITACTNKTILVTGKGGRRSREVKTQVGYAKVTLQPPKPHGFRRGMRSLPLTLIRVWEDGVDLTHAKTQATKQKESETQEQLQLAQNENRKAAEQVKAASGVLEKAKSKAAKEAARQDLQEANRQASEALSLLQKRQEAAEQAKQTHKQASQTEQGMLDWWLGTSLPINTPEEALQAVSDYEWRWPVAEEYHKVEKSGLQMEKQRFRGDALLAMMAVLSILAIRILQMRYAREGDPQGPATSIASREEIEMVEMVSKQVGKLTTVAKWVDAVAKLGGYLGRKGDGPPGWMTLWRGYQRLRDILLGAELALSNQANKGEVNQEA
jgi:hypothetical protein